MRYTRWMYHIFRVVAELFTSIAIIVFIIKTDVMMAVSVIILAGVCFAGVVLGFRKPMQRLGVQYRQSNGEAQKHSLQAFQGIKEVIVMHRQQFFVSRYEKAFQRQQKALIGQTVASESPAYIIEAVCVAGLILAVSFRVYSGTDTTAFHTTAGSLCGLVRFASFHPWAGSAAVSTRSFTLFRL